ncbi:alpha/beta hydrolase [Dactylosporangium sp. NPDC051485]|uniref:alpha/beta hydrolase n=1 Tax=Dactylosporangium sp. NPDC051485 TaxID=3154846 RepID=UPI00343F453F
MNDVAELKEFAVTHARAQNIAGYRDVLARVDNDEDGAEGSWAIEWTRAGAALEERGKHLEAAQCYNMGRFPFVDGPARSDALRRCVAAFDRWRGPGIERIAVDGGQVRGWAAGLSAAKPRPLLLITGGIVSIKEQWAPILSAVTRLGMAGVVTEMPGVGENSLPYTPDSWRMLSTVLDAVAGRADVSRTYALALSFSGHLAMRCALDDPRIRAVVTAGAPVRGFFTDRAWLRTVPRLTMDTLAHLTRTGRDDVAGQLDKWALTDEQLRALEIPVYYMKSARDEIIPPAEAELVRSRVREAHLLEHDDTHGSPGHITETRLWSVWAVLHARRALPAQRLALGAALRLLRARPPRR